MPTSSACPACYHKGSYYQPGETWTDESKCANYTCLRVSNPCMPLNKSVQIDVKIPVCQACPQGFKTVPNKDKCCPDCVPTEDIDSKCGVKYMGTVKVKGNVEGQVCETQQKVPVRACVGFCSSAIFGLLGDSDALHSPCSCCKPNEVKQRNVTITCADNSIKETVYNEILSCSCRQQTCGVPTDINIQKDEEKVKRSTVNRRSIMEQLEELDSANDEVAHRRRRRELLNDLAMIHANKRRR